MSNIENIEVVEPAKNPRGRPRITDQSLRKTPLVRSKIIGRPKEFELTSDIDAKDLYKFRYKERYSYTHKAYYFVRNNAGLIPQELLDLPTITDEEIKNRYFLMKTFIDTYKSEQEKLISPNYTIKLKKTKTSIPL